jgi:16S rRNA (guanine527-N7)-methyltransferase
VEGLEGVSRETVARLETYLFVLAEWQERLNLVSRETLQDGWCRHVVDSAQLASFLKNNHDLKIADLGTGAGFPGMVLAILGYGQVTLFESNYKKCTFLREVRRRLQVPVEIFEGRLETYKGPLFDFVVSRALSSLDNLLSHTPLFLKENGKCLFLKGRDVEAEIEKAKEIWAFQFQKKKSITNPEGAVLLVEDIKRL